MNRVDNIAKNMKSTIFTQIPLFIISFVVRRVFIVVLGEQYLGLNGQYSVAPFCRSAGLRDFHHLQPLSPHRSRRPGED